MTAAREHVVIADAIDSAMFVIQDLKTGNGIVTSDRLADAVIAALNAAGFVIAARDMKREIESAAYRRGYRQAVEDATAKQPCTAENPREDAYQHGRFDGVMDYGRAIRSLIQPPAQKENVDVS